MPEVINLCDSDDEADDAPQYPSTLSRQQASSSARRAQPSSARPPHQHTISDPVRHKLDPRPRHRPKEKPSSSTVSAGRSIDPLPRPSSAAQSTARPILDAKPCPRPKEKPSSSSSRVVSEGLSSHALPRERPAAQLTARPSHPSVAAEQRSPQSSTATPAGVTRRDGLGVTGFRNAPLLSSDNVAPRIPTVGLERERGQKRAHDDKKRLPSGHSPLKKLKASLPEHPRASAPSSKAVYGRFLESVPSSSSKGSEIVSLLTSDEDEESPAAASSRHRNNRSQTNASLPSRTILGGGELDHTGRRLPSPQPPMSRKSPIQTSRNRQALESLPSSPQALPSWTSGGAPVQSDHNSQQPSARQSPGSACGSNSSTYINPQRSANKELESLRRSSIGSNDRSGERRSTIPESPQSSHDTTRQLESPYRQLVVQDDGGISSSHSAPLPPVHSPRTPANELAVHETRAHHDQVLSEPETSHPAPTTATEQPKAVRHADRESDEDTTYGSTGLSVPGERRLPCHFKEPEKNAISLASGSDACSGDSIAQSHPKSLPQAAVVEEAAQNGAAVDASIPHLPYLDSQQVCAPPATFSAPPCVSEDPAVPVPEPKSCEDDVLTATESGPNDICTASVPGPPSIERLVGQYIEEMRDDNEHWTRIELQRNQMKVPGRTRTNTTSVFRNLKPLDLKPAGKPGVPADCVKFTCEVHGTTSKPAKNSWFMPYTTINTGDTVDVPRYSHYVGISQNILGNNVTSLQHWPYFGDEFDMSNAYSLNKEYYVDVDSRERKLLRLGQAENFAPYADDLISSVGVEWSDVLRFLLELEPDTGTSPDAIKALRDRERFTAEDFFRDGERWGEVLGMLPAPLPDRIGRAAVLCDHFQRIAGFPFWHMVRRASYTKSLVAKTARTASDEELTCRVCMRFNCPYHGEIRDHPDRSKDASDADNEAVETDIILPQIVNFRIRVTIPQAVDSEPASTDKKRTLDYWKKGGRFGNLEWEAGDRGPSYPCDHPGVSCTDAQCSCFNERIACEKTCSCGPGCKRKWKGCLCRSGKRPRGKFVCWEDERCACFQKGRECDPDLCGDCGVADVLDPVHRHDDRILRNRCRGASLQRGVPKHTILGNSGIAGLGLYACEDIRGEDFVGEYRGECITKDESERRSAVYEHQKLSYLFSLNSNQDLDATYFGNKLRFINHAASSKSNLEPRTIMVNSIFRIGMYAKRDIRAGEELFYDYGPQYGQDYLSGTAVEPTKASRSRPHVRNSMNVKDFHDVDISLDQLGNVRATKAVGASGGDGVQEEGLAGELNGRLGSARTGASRSRKSKSRMEESAAAQQPTDQQVDDTDPQQRLSLYNITEDRSDDDDFEPGDEPPSDGDNESESE